MRRFIEATDWSNSLAKFAAAPKAFCALEIRKLSMSTDGQAALEFSRHERSTPASAPDLSCVIDIYRQAFLQSGATRAALLDPKDRGEQRFNALTAPIKTDGFSLLDYGCGLADLKANLDRRFASYDYEGVDIVDEFVASCRTRYPSTPFRCIRGVEDIDRQYDFIIASGVFSISLSSPREQKQLIEYTIEKLFKNTRKALCIDFMRSDVEFRQENAYHQNIPEINAFVSQLSSRFIIDKSYLPYEFALLIYKNENIKRPESTFGPL